LKKIKHWKCVQYGRNAAHKGTLSKKVGNLSSGSEHRITAAFELIKTTEL
jgi:hypothetical protein